MVLYWQTMDLIKMHDLALWCLLWHFITKYLEYTHAHVHCIIIFDFFFDFFFFFLNILFPGFSEKKLGYHYCLHLSISLSTSTQHCWTYFNQIYSSLYNFHVCCSLADCWFSNDHHSTVEDKKVIQDEVNISLFLHKTIYCRYSLEAPQT